MIIKELDSQVLEPVSLFEVREHLGYSEGDTAEDDILVRHITAMRQLLETNLGRYIALRAVLIIPEPGPIRMPSPLRDVVSFRCTDQEGEILDIQYVRTGSDMNPTVHWTMESGCVNPQMVAMVGYDVCPEDIKSAICDLVKAKYERAPLTPVLDDVMHVLAPYRRINL